ncbi:MAG: hypothetical protein IJZ02_02330 [Clostridia bacterium]|nr:hypothetical protein [Clostridia bacterium]
MPKNKKKSAPRRREKELTPAQQVKRRLGEFNWRLLLILAVNTVVIFGLYRILVGLGYFVIISSIYFLVLLGLICGYIIYNRAMVARNITPDQLPEDWSEEKKKEFFAEAERRVKRSKWMLTLIFPLCITFCFEIIYLYIIDPWMNR